VLRRIELEALSTVDRGDTISNSRRNSTTASYLSRAVGDLVEKGLVYTERDGRRKQVVPSDARAVERYRDLVRQHSHIEFPELLTGKALEVLYYLDQPRTVSGSPTGATTTRNTVNRVLKRFRDQMSSSGRPTAATSSTPISTASTSLPVNSHTICIVTASKPSPEGHDSLGGLR